MDGTERKSKTLFIRNLPFNTNNDTLERKFSDIGPLKKCFVVKNKDEDKCKGYGYVSYSLQEDAEKAKDQVKSLDGRKLYISYANKKKDSKLKTSYMPSKQETVQTEKEVKVKTEEEKKEELFYLKAKTLVVTGFTDEDKVQPTLDKLNIKNISKTDFPVKGRDELTVFIRFKSIKDLKKGQKKLESKGLHVVQLSKENKTVPQKLLKRARLIVRNLSFQCKEPQLQEVFSKFGDVNEVKIPTKPDGKMFGFGFVQFTSVSSAEKALQNMNSKMIRGRMVAVDWAVPKDQFEQENKVESDQDSSSDDEDKSSESEKSDDEMSVEEDDVSSDEDEEDSEDEVDDDDEDDDDDESSTDGSSDEGFHESSSKESKQKKEMQEDKRAEDGRTLFISQDGDKSVIYASAAQKCFGWNFYRNLSYDTEEETLSEIMTEFGRINYCKIVMDPKTEHSKGSGFVQFKTNEDAEACLKKAENQDVGMVVDGRKLLITKAVSRQKATELRKKEKVKEDKRNVHLVREGLIRAGTQDAEGITKDDLARRQKLQNVKRMRLKNPNIFVSTTRLCVHNLPKNVDEKQLKSIFRTAAGSQAWITECRIMRDTEKVNAQGVAKSRGYAFVNFTEHEHALQTLRKTNNNPDLFKDGRRVIVEFSLENKNALLAKEKRLERFKTRQNQLKQEKSKEGSVKNDNSTDKKDKKSKKLNKDRQKISERYIGNVKLPEGKSIKNVLPTHWGPKVRHKARPQKDQQTSKPKPEKRKQEFDQSPVKQKRRKKQEKTDNFDKLVNSYKQKIMTSKSKWFEN